MQPLLKIQTIPIKIEAQTKRASLQASTDPVPTPKQRPAPRQSAPVQQKPAPQQRPAPQARQRAENQIQQDTRANQTDNPGNYLKDAMNAVQAYGQNVAVSEVSLANSDAVEYQTPATDNYVSAQSAVSTSFDYSMDRETFDWNTNSKPQLEYIPASIEYSISQYPDVVIEYIGEPIYVPASANPNYVPPPGEKKN